MRILMTGPVPPHPGGGAISRGELSAGFAEAGHPVCVLAPITAEGLRGGDEYAALHPGVSVVRYLLSHFEKMPFRPPPPEFAEEERAQVERLFAIVAESFRPDVVVVGRETFARYVPALAKQAGLPLVQLVRGSPTGHILRGEYPPDEADRLFTEFRKADRIIAVAEYLAEGLRARGLANVSAIPNAINLERFRPGLNREALRQELQIPRDASVVLAPANLHPRKRPADVLCAAERVLAARNDVVFVMAGTGVLRKQIESQSAELGLSSHFRFPGWISYSRMPELMNLADVVVMTSEAEGMARAYIEALACERALIASDIPPARELVQDGVNGVLFALGDPVELAARVLGLLRDEPLRLRLGKRGRESVRHRSVSKAVPLYLAEFTNAIQ